MRTSEEIDYLADLIRSGHIEREDIPAEPLKPKPFRARPVPRTALISKAAQQAIIGRECLEAECLDQ